MVDTLRIVSLVLLGVSGVLCAPLNETLIPSNWTSSRLANGVVAFESPNGRIFGLNEVLTIITEAPSAISNLPSLVQSLGIEVAPTGIKLDGSWLLDQLLSMTRELLPLPETVFFGGANQPLRMGPIDVRVGSVMFYNGHLKGHGSVQRNGPAEVSISTNSRSHVGSGLIWNTLELLYEIDVEIFGLIRQPRKLLAQIDTLGFSSKFSVDTADFAHFFDPQLDLVALIDIGHISFKHTTESQGGVLDQIDNVVDAFMQDLMEKTVYPRLELNLKLSLKDAGKWLNVIGLKRATRLEL
ncbi:unnamed protein product [Notodromas monacha]|uniref:Uncharacterized protein n=1 Tax=Notodromas monacha TaxID=399045 RepID=A0A7R9BRX5_9CRUS|nr:unnamed protein product [Notodromas monacha]CAG0919205.1 unnamed protein product [Notodromas monacha]